MSNQRVIEVGQEYYGIEIRYDELKDFNYTKELIRASDAVIVSNTFRCSYEFELFRHLIKTGAPYIRWEHDYGFCAKRNGYCFVTSKVKNCCSSQRFRHFRNHFANSRLAVFTSPRHLDYHREIYGGALHSVFVLPPPIRAELYAEHVEKEKDTVCFLGELNSKKGGHGLIGFAEKNPHLTINVFGENGLGRKLPSNVTLHRKVGNHQVADVLSRSEYFFFRPVWPEPAGRVAAEAFLAGCKMVCNDRVGTLSYPFIPDDRDEAVRQLTNGPRLFWERFLDEVRRPARGTDKWNQVLVYKSYGGLGDVLLALPAMLKITEVALSTTIAVPEPLTGILAEHVGNARVISLQDMDVMDIGSFDKVIDIGNYPSFRKRKGSGDRLTFPSHRRVLQHAVKHYVEAVSALHPHISNEYGRYPYFPRDTERDRPFFTVHPGAGFSPKCWPEENFARLIPMILGAVPNLSCKLILGKNDPDDGVFDRISSDVQIVRDELSNVARTISGSLFHIGNDSGITHLAGLFNIPTVAIHGPSGPGTWSSFSEIREVIWGKPGKCGISCNYNTAVTCEHRACLTSVSAEKVFHATLSLIRKMDLADGGPSRYMLSPLARIGVQGSGIHIVIGDEEFFVETEEAGIFTFFETLIQQRFIDDGIVAANPEASSFLESKNVLFRLPVTALASS